jgi:hypothetical protein
MYNSGDERTHEYLLQRNFPSAEELTALYAVLNDMVSNPIGATYAGTVSFTRNQILTHLPGWSSSLSRALELLAESGLIAYDKNSIQGRTSAVRFLMPRQRREEYIYRSRNGAGVQLIRKFHVLEDDAGLGMELYFNADEVIAALSLDRSSYGKAMRLLEANGILTYKAASFAPPDSKTYSISFLSPRVHEEDITLPLEKLQKAFDHTLGKLREVQRYATTWNCRAAMILNYFGENQEGGKCGKCDVCSSKMV